MAVTVNKIEIPGDLVFLNLDDIESVRTLVTKQLQTLGFQGKILEAENVTAAKNIIATQSVDFIISDWNLPDGTGLEFLKEVRKNIKFKETPFLMVTTEDAISNILEAVNEGASNYLVKPWKADEFNEKLSYAWTKHHPIEKKIVRKKVRV